MTGTIAHRTQVVTFTGGPYTGNASKSAAGAAADITTAMYAKTHVALNKVNVSILSLFCMASKPANIQTYSAPKSGKY